MLMLTVLALVWRKYLWVASIEDNGDHEQPHGFDDDGSISRFNEYSSTPHQSGGVSILRKTDATVRAVAKQS